MIELEIFMEPVSWTPSRICRNIRYNPKSKEKNKAIQLISRSYSGEIINEPVVIDFIIKFLPPKSSTKKQKELMLSGEIIPTKKDCTNVQKFFEDCLKGVVITDDRLVQKISSQKLYAEKESVVIKIFTLKEHRNATQERKIQENNQ